MFFKPPIIRPTHFSFSFNIMANETDKSHNERNSLSDLEDCPLTGEDDKFNFKRPRTWYSKSPANNSPIWKICCLLSMALSFIFLVMLLNHSKLYACPDSRAVSMPVALENYPSSTQAWKEENLIETKFYRDLRYMSLAHEMDYLWKEHTLMATGNIKIPAKDGTGNSSLMSISM
jgi:hypothetical protein